MSLATATAAATETAKASGRDTSSLSATVLWDLNSVHIPMGIPPHRITRILKDLVERSLPKDKGKGRLTSCSFTGMGNLSLLQDSVKHELELSGITLQHSTSRKDSAVDIAILTNIMMLVHSAKDPSLHHIYIITGGESDYSTTCNFLDQIGFKVTLILCKRENVSEVLLDSAKDIIVWGDLLAPLMVELKIPPTEDGNLTLNPFSHSNPTSPKFISTASPKFKKTPFAIVKSASKSNAETTHTTTEGSPSKKFQDIADRFTFQERGWFGELFSLLAQTDPPNAGILFCSIGTLAREFGVQIKEHYGKMSNFLAVAKSAGLVLLTSNDTTNHLVKRNLPTKPALLNFHPLIKELGKDGGRARLSKLGSSFEKSWLQELGFSGIRDYLLDAQSKGLVSVHFLGGYSFCELKGDHTTPISLVVTNNHSVPASPIIKTPKVIGESSVMARSSNCRLPIHFIPQFLKDNMKRWKTLRVEKQRILKKELLDFVELQIRSGVEIDLAYISEWLEKSVELELFFKNTSESYYAEKVLLSKFLLSTIKELRAIDDNAMAKATYAHFKPLVDGLSDAGGRDLMGKIGFLCRPHVQQSGYETFREYLIAAEDQGLVTNHFMVGGGEYVEISTSNAETIEKLKHSITAVPHSPKITLNQPAAKAPLDNLALFPQIQRNHNSSNKDPVPLNEVIDLVGVDSDSEGNCDSPLGRRHTMESAFSSPYPTFASVVNKSKENTPSSIRHDEQLYQSFNNAESLLRLVDDEDEGEEEGNLSKHFQSSASAKAELFPPAASSASTALPSPSAMRDSMLTGMKEKLKNFSFE